MHLERPTRRTYLRGLGTAATLVVAGCVGAGDGSLTLAYMPIYPDLQYFVMDGEGYLANVEADIDAREFTDGPAIVQAFGADEIDIASSRPRSCS